MSKEDIEKLRKGIISFYAFLIFSSSFIFLTYNVYNYDHNKSVAEIFEIYCGGLVGACILTFFFSTARIRVISDFMNHFIKPNSLNFENKNVFKIGFFLGFFDIFLLIIIFCILNFLNLFEMNKCNKNAIYFLYFCVIFFIPAIICLLYLNSYKSSN
jgi:uncharacterized membrane protein YfcA